MAASISVVVPAYNAELTLSDTLDSISKQTRRPLDVVVVDDGSKDRTAEVARSYADRLPNLQVISVANGGVSRARNIAIAASRGEIIAPIDSDDMWHPTYLERVGARLEELGPDAAFAYSFWRSINAQSMVSNLNDVIGIDGMGFYRLLVHNFVGNGSNLVMWRHRVEALGGFNEKLPGNEDYDMQLRLAWSGPMGVVPERLIGYRDSPNSLSKQWRLMATNGIPMLQKLREDLPADSKAMDWAMSSSHLHFHLVIILFGAGSWVEAIQHFAIGTRYDPLHAFFRVGASVKFRLYRRLEQLKGGWKPPVIRPFVGIHFYDIEPTVNWPTILPRFTRLRLAESEHLDRQRAGDLGLDAPGATMLEFPEKFPPGWAGPDPAMQG